MPTTTRKPAPPPPPLPEAKKVNFIADWTLTALLVLFGTTTLCQAYIVPTGSMEGHVMVGDFVLADKLAYSPASSWSKNLLPYQDVQRGDIIVFRYPLNLRENYVKRVIGVPGDRIRFDNKQLVLNGKRVSEPYVRHIPEQQSRYLNEFPSHVPDVMIYNRAADMLTAHVRDGELVVPEGHYLALGDNRDNSADSRFWGLVPRENIVGKPLVIVWSFDANTEQLSGGFLNPELVWEVAQHLFTRTRWDRSLRLLRSYPLAR